MRQKEEKKQRANKVKIAAEKAECNWQQSNGYWCSVSLGKQAVREIERQRKTVGAGRQKIM